MSSINLTEVNRAFDYVRTQLTGEHNGDAVDDVYADGYAPINGGGWAARKKGRNIGRIWHRVTDGVWYATPETAVNWSDLEWFGPFRSRAEAAMFLVAMATPRPRVCPCCHRPVIIGRGPDFMIWQRDGITPHSCAGATVSS
jgi:hypothetical protein